ncbi:hypothetical protein [Blastococcus sp. CCUG 61487]|uniref:hypothetical protein n=1 Tax=Blastococcus sp. CCUG 61487 TaxID=1840703 RepID=UPI0010C04EED|nr:hypothetical protein [Blastococcus sp. CCUG 61487]TKJ25255.1 hypothetical protein A6V29_04335 [Blastococcus sp. CCUG 61487]
MTVPIPQSMPGEYIGPRYGSLKSGDPVVDAKMATAASASRFTQRLDRLDEELTKAHNEVAAFAQRLKPVLPPEFEKTAMPESRLARDPGEPPASPLGERLAAATERAFALVHRLRAISEAVDL